MTLILVCGGRDYDDWRLVRNILDSASKKYTSIRLMAGGAKGADTLAENWAKQNQVEFLRIPARWGTEGKAAGPLRNKRMLAESPDLVIAFPGGAGTAHMVKIAQEANIKVIEIS